MKIDPSEYIRVGTAAKLMGVTRAYIHKVVVSGKLPSVPIDGQHFIRRKDAEKAKKAREAARKTGV